MSVVEPTTVYPYSSIVRITDVIGGVTWQASGVLIAPDEVLTASHVVYSSTYGLASNVTVIPAYDAGAAPYGSATATYIHYFPISDGGGVILESESQYDFAVIHLSQPIFAAGTMGLQADFTGGYANVTGYPGAYGGAMDTVSEYMSQDPYYTLLDGTSLGPGSSGGPVWVAGPNGTANVVGLVSSEQGGAGSAGFFTQITAGALSLIQSWVAADRVPPTVSGQNVTVAENAAIPASSMIAAVSNPSGDSITQYRFLDGGGDGGYFTVNGVAQADGQWFSVSASSLASVSYVGGSAPGQEILGVAVYDATTGSYSATGYLSATTIAPQVSNDFNGDGRSDILWRDSSGGVVEWQMNGFQSSNATPIGGGDGWNIVGTGDFYGTGKSDLLWQNGSGPVVEWQMNGTQATSSSIIGGGGGWTVAGTGDFNGDGKSDILWRDLSGHVVEWQMNGAQASQMTFIGGSGDWTVVGTGDFNGDGKSDILWQNSSGGVVEWQMNGSQMLSSAVLGGGAGWSVVGTGDFSGDGKAGILWQDGSGSVYLWEMNGYQVQSSTLIGGGTGWNVVGTGDFNGDGKTDILWQDGAGTVIQWDMNGSQVLNAAVIGGGAGWSVAGQNPAQRILAVHS